MWSKPGDFELLLGCSEDQQALTVLSEEHIWLCIWEDQCRWRRTGCTVLCLWAAWGGAVLLSLSPFEFLSPASPGGAKLGHAPEPSGVVWWMSLLPVPGKGKLKGHYVRHYAKSLALQEEIGCLLTCTWKLYSSSYCNLQLHGADYHSLNLVNKRVVWRPKV